jgi:hypothetical protein
MAAHSGRCHANADREYWVSFVAMVAISILSLGKVGYGDGASLAG